MKNERSLRARLAPEHFTHNASEAVERQSQVDGRARDVYGRRNPNHRDLPTSAATTATTSWSPA
jgi:hypothetical protein